MCTYILGRLVAVFVRKTAGLWSRDNTGEVPDSVQASEPSIVNASIGIELRLASAALDLHAQPEHTHELLRHSRRFQTVRPSQTDCESEMVVYYL